MNSNAYILVYILNEKIEDYDKYYNNLKDIMDNIIEDEKHFIEIKKSNNFYEGEPVKTDYGEGYVMNDSLQNDKYVRVKLEYFYVSVIKSKVIKQTILNYKEK
jgi:L-rhamnose isomerase